MLTSLDNFIPADQLLLLQNPGNGNSLLQPGDLIEIDRKIYSHWVLYIGNGDVMQVAGPDSDLARIKGFVLRSKLVEVAGDSLVRVNNKVVPAKERGLTSLPHDVTIQTALALTGTTVPYNLLTRNSEHYVTEWKYNFSWSDQADTALQAMSAFFSSPNMEDPEAAHLKMLTGINRLLDSTISSNKER